MLSFQKLHVYQASIEFAAEATRIVNRMPRGHGALSDQLRRASFSISLNIAEGAGRATKSDAARHYAIARGSAMECAAVLDIAQLVGAVDEHQHRSGVDLLGRVVAMLTKMCR